MNDYEVNSSISNDKKLAKITMEGLTSYAELLEKQKSASPAVTQIRRIVDELGAYWDVDEKHNWIGEFAKRALGRISVDIQEKDRIATINGLFSYAKEMGSAQGADELERILEIPPVIRQIGEAWNMEKDWIDNICSSIVEMTELLQTPLGMTMKY